MHGLLVAIAEPFLSPIVCELQNEISCFGNFTSVPLIRGYKNNANIFTIESKRRPIIRITYLKYSYCKDGVLFFPGH